MWLVTPPSHYCREHCKCACVIYTLYMYMSCACAQHDVTCSRPELIIINYYVIIEVHVGNSSIVQVARGEVPSEVLLYMIYLQLSRDFFYNWFNLPNINNQMCANVDKCFVRVQFSSASVYMGTYTVPPFSSLSLSFSLS